MPDEPAAVPLGVLVDWLNEHGRAVEAERQQLVSLLERQPDLKSDPDFEFKLGKVGGVTKVLTDFKGLLMAQSADRAGQLDIERFVE